MKQELLKTSKIASLKKAWKDHRILFILCLLFILLIVYRAGVFFLGGSEEDAASAVNVKVAEATYQAIEVTSPIAGRIKPLEEVAIIPMAAGQVTAVHVSVGDYVYAGDLLFEIDKGQISTSYNQAKEAYDSVAATYSRIEMLYKEGAVSKQDYESAKAQYISAKEAFNSASNAYGYYNVTSPIDGYVTALSVSTGSMAGTTMLGAVANIEELIIETSISETLAGKITVGDAVEVYVGSLDKIFTGRITSFSPIPSLGTLTYPLTVTMDSSEELFAGMFAEVRLVSDQVQEALCIPSEAVIIKDGKSVVAVLDADSVPDFREVITGIDNGRRVEILSGIEEGDIVVYSGQHYVTPGIAVNVAED